MIKGLSGLVLEISRQENWLSMSIVSQDALSSTLRHYSRSTYPEETINNLCQEIAFLIHKSDRHGNIEPDFRDKLVKAGQLLWDHLLTRPVKEKILSSPVQGLIFSVDEELIDIPWELLHDGSDFLCFKFDIGRVVRTRQPQSLPQYRDVHSKLKMLILADPTNDLKTAYREGLFIKNQFEKRRGEVSIDFKSTRIDRMYIKKNLRDYDIVHFAGHCEYMPLDPQQTGWVMSDGKFTVQDILALGETFSLPSVVFSNSCHSAEVSAEALHRDFHTASYSLAGAFIFSGVRHYIGTIRKVEDEISIFFAQRFYTGLIGGKSVGECIRHARLNLRAQYGENNIAWVNYLLYGDPSFSLFRLRQLPSLARAKISKRTAKKIALRSLIGVLVVSCITLLVLLLPTINPNSYGLFLKSRWLAQQGNNKEAIRLSERVIKNDPLFLAVYPLRAQAYEKMGKRDEAIKAYFDYALSSERKDDDKNLASAYIGIGWTYHLKGAYEKAFDFYQKAISLSRTFGDKAGEAIGMRKLAVWYIDKEEYNRALELLMKSSEINRSLRRDRASSYNLACDYFDIALVFVNKDDLEAAREFYKKSLQIFEQLKLKGELSDYYFNLGEIHVFEKHYQKALDCYLRGLRIDEAQQNIPSIISDYTMLGELYMDMDNIPQAQECFSRSLKLAEGLDVPLESAAAFHNLGRLYKKLGRKSKAREYMRKAQEIYVSVDIPEYQRMKVEFQELE